MALHLYKREHGAFPETLNALVPTYLPAVPKDYFDGAPIRYSREFEVVWSVGENNLTVSQPDFQPERNETFYYLTPRPKPEPAGVSL